MHMHAPHASQSSESWPSQYVPFASSEHMPAQLQQLLHEGKNCFQTTAHDFGPHKTLRQPSTSCRETCQPWHRANVACVRTTSGLHVYIQKQTDLQAVPVHGDEAYAEREINTTAKLSSMSDPGGNRPQAQDRIRRRQSQWGTFTIGRRPAHPEQSRQRITQEGILLGGLQALLRQQKAAY